jgi:hypothetical protein
MRRNQSKAAASPPATSPSATATPTGLGSKIDSIVLAFLILAMCTQFDLTRLGRDTLATEGYVTKQLAVALPDVALLLAFIWFVARTTMLRAWGRVWWPPLPCWALIFTLVVSTIHSPHVVTAVSDALAEASGPKAIIKALLAKESKEAIAETVQWTAYFLFAPLLFVNWIYDRRKANTATTSDTPFITGVSADDGNGPNRLKLALHAFAGAVFLNIAFALLQRFIRGSEAPTGLFSSPNAYGAFIAIAMPFLFAQSLWLWRRSPALIMTMLCFGGALLTFTSVWAAMGLLFGLVFVGGILGHRHRSTALLLAAIPILLLWDAPSQLRQNRIDSLRVSSPTQKVKKQFIEWYAAAGTSLPRHRQLATGAGPGNYQFNIGSYYNRLPNEEKMPPDSNNLYLVQTVAIGVLGVATLFWMFLHFARQAWLTRSPDRWLAGATLASLVVFAWINIFHAAIVRGTGVVIAFILSLAVLAIYQKQQAPSE